MLTPGSSQQETEAEYLLLQNFVFIKGTKNIIADLLSRDPGFRSSAFQKLQKYYAIIPQDRFENFSHEIIELDNKVASSWTLQAISNPFFRNFPLKTYKEIRSDPRY